MRTLLLASLALFLGLGSVGCKSTQPDDPGLAPITEVKLEAPTAPASSGSSYGSTSYESNADVVALRAENQTLREEMQRVQSENRAREMEVARLREEVLSRPLGASPMAASMPAPEPATVAIASPSRASESSGGGGASGAYSVQAASYANSDKGRSAAEKLVRFFESKGFAPTMYRESGKYLIVLVGAYGSKDEAKAARERVADLAYNGRQGDFASATVRKN